MKSPFQNKPTLSENGLSITFTNPTKPETYVISKAQLEHRPYATAIHNVPENTITIICETQQALQSFLSSLEIQT